MSDLPDDVRRWPNDPFKLLGVPQNVPPRELKRAYTRLIRAYKPEHAPEEFRRIRDAYDAVRQFVEMFGALPRTEAAETFETEGGAVTEALPREGGAAVESRPSQSITPLEEKLDECWRWAIDGDETKAYQELAQLHAQLPHDARIGARLYWLLTLNPHIDPNRSPCDWLAVILRRNGLSGPLRELYRRELAANPAEALSRRCSDLLDAVPASSGLIDLVEWRWQAIARTEQAPELIRADLAKLRERFLPHDEESWARLVFAAADRIAFFFTGVSRDVMARCQRDLEGLGHLHLRMSAAFDHYELLLEIAEKSRNILRGGASRHAELVAIACGAWNTPIEELRPRLMAYLATVAERPGQALQNFDAVLRIASSLLFQFRRALILLDSITEPPDDQRTPTDIAKLAVTFARDTPGAHYSEWRAPLLDFCLREVVMPEQVAAALAEYGDFIISGGQHLSEAVANDLPLVCVCHACRLIWA